MQENNLPTRWFYDLPNILGPYPPISHVLARLFMYSVSFHNTFFSMPILQLTGKYHISCHNNCDIISLNNLLRFFIGDHRSVGDNQANALNVIRALNQYDVYSEKIFNDLMSEQLQDRTSAVRGVIEGALGDCMRADASRVQGEKIVVDIKLTDKQKVLLMDNYQKVLLMDNYPEFAITFGNNP